MAASNTDLFKKLTNNFSTTLTGAVIGTGDTSMSLNSTTNLPTDTGIVLVIDRVSASGTTTPTLREYVKGVVSGTNVTALVRGLGNSTAQAHLSGAIVEQVVDQTTINELVSGVLLHANQDGSLIPLAVQTALGISSSPTSGWNLLNAGVAPASTINNGAGSYTLQYNGVDLTPVLSAGMRLLATHTANPIQSAKFDGSTQYFTKVAPAGITFTDTFSIGCYVKLAAYSSSVQTLVRRGLSASGFALDIDITGVVRCYGTLSTGNYKGFSSNQSIPLNKNVHIVATYSMSTGTGNMYFNGVLVSTFVGPFAGTATALTNSGDLAIGAGSDGTSKLNGKMTQAFVASVVLPQAQVRAIYSQGLVAADVTTYSLVSAYSLSGANGATDINTVNANNLTANGTVTTTNADAPYGNSGKSATIDYAIIMSDPVFSVNTTINVQVPDGCTLPTTAAAITNLQYSSLDTPFGFPKQTVKWSIYLTMLTTVNTSGTVGATIYNPGGVNLTVPIGPWKLRTELQSFVSVNASSLDVTLGLSTVATAMTIPELTSRVVVNITATSATQINQHVKSDYVLLTTATPYYVLFYSAAPFTSAGIHGGVSSPLMDGSIVVAENSYL